MQFSKRTFKIHPNCLWNFYGKKKTKQKKSYSLVKRSLSQGNWLRHQQLGSAHPKVERHLVSFRYYNPVCRVVMLSLGSLSTTKQRLYTPCVYNTFFFNRSWKCTARSRDPLSAQLPQRRRDSSADFGLCAGHWRIVSLLNEWGLTGQKKYIIEYIL